MITVTDLFAGGVGPGLLLLGVFGATLFYGDTGTNLFLTFESASAALAEAGAGLDLRDTVRTFAHGALLGARGNSGIILSQLVRGFADALDLNR